MARLGHWLALALVAALAVAASPMALADATADTDPGGARITITSQQLREYAAANLPGVEGPKYEYSWTSYCSKGGPESADKDPWCDGAVTACTRINTSGPGPAVFVWRKLTQEADGTAVTDGAWDRLGLTCFPDLVPGRAGALTMAHILQAFHDTPFSTPYASIQPVNLRTLVNLPTYFAAAYPTTGYQPGEVDTTTILGFRVEIRPTATSYTYHFGDGTTLGPTEDPGGPYPDGAIRHTYQRTATYPVRVDTVYSGQFRVNGGQWIDIPDTVTIQGTTSQLQVLEAVTRLH
ncbi:MAG: hypothetical protein IPL94_09035 [Tetrasphaera sp.]|nr:hypothetical protein [Tetrasphaera sp.]